VQRAKPFLKEEVKNLQQLTRSRLRTARRVAQSLHRQLRRKGEDKEAEQQAQRLLEHVKPLLPLVARVIVQTRSRVIEGKKVADPVFTGLDECTRETADTCIQK